jgi:hypothetical protein
VGALTQLGSRGVPASAGAAEPAPRYMYAARLPARTHICSVTEVCTALKGKQKRDGLSAATSDHGKARARVPQRAACVVHAEGRDGLLVQQFAQERLGRQGARRQRVSQVRLPCARPRPVPIRSFQALVLVAHVATLTHSQKSGLVYLLHKVTI